MGLDGRIEERLQALRSGGLYRDPDAAAREVEAVPPRLGWIDARSNDYLGLASARVAAVPVWEPGQPERGGAAAGAPATRSASEFGAFPEVLADGVSRETAFAREQRAAPAPGASAAAAAGPPAGAAQLKVASEPRAADGGGGAGATVGEPVVHQAEGRRVDTSGADGARARASGAGPGTGDSAALGRGARWKASASEADNGGSQSAGPRATELGPSEPRGPARPAPAELGPALARAGAATDAARVSTGAGRSELVGAEGVGARAAELGDGSGAEAAMARPAPRRSPGEGPVGAEPSEPWSSTSLGPAGPSAPPGARGGPSGEGAAPCRPSLPGVSRETGVALGAGAARLISGTSREHLALEAALADWLGAEACLLFSSAYAANLGAISALALPGDVVLSDALNHASIIDGCRLSRARTVVTPHRDLEALRAELQAATRETGARWVVSESYFGMDGTSPDFRALRALCDEYDAALLIDEAHSLGTFGPQGKGLCAAAGVRPDIITGGFGKALGLQGGFVASSKTVRSWLWNRARSFVFSTGTSPWLSAQALLNVAWARGADEERTRLAGYAELLAGRLSEAGVPLPAGRHGPIFPIVFGSEAATLAAAASLRRSQVLAQAVRPPTVPRGTARLRLTLRADLSRDEVLRIADAVVEVWRGRAGPETNDESASAGGLPEPSPGRATEAPTSEPARRRCVVLGTGTGIGKSHVAEALVRALAATGRAVAGLKPIETGCRTGADGGPVEGDARRLEEAAFHVKHPRPHPFYAFAEPVAPALAARSSSQTISLEAIASWADRVRSLDPQSDPHLIIETAGGVFSPLGDELSNYDLAQSLGPAVWLLVAPDRLGVLHDVASTVRAMRTLGRAPDWILLNALPPGDSSSGTNAAELRRLRLGVPILELASDDVIRAIFNGPSPVG